MKKRRKPWDCIALGKSDQEIGRALNYSASSILWWRKKNGLPPNPRKRKYDEDKLLELYAEGYSDAKIAAELGCCRDVVFNFRQRNELPALHGIGGRLRKRGAGNA
ncbi:helix-turn-helix domain-containing protein [Thermosinus carboxydivorans]|uniref:helix-turn-helix domain-containing protein n=1 Tax=Thermosinus carboxydivorans TaxID=261685 RepID=UPI000594E95F|nr:helix-turn-helix domain-containing protein [Thermosinus carboxydivorans]